MGKSRKNQPGYVEGVDKLGRRAWRRLPGGIIQAPPHAALRDISEDPLTNLYNLYEEKFEGVDFNNRKIIYPEIVRVQFKDCEMNGALITAPGWKDELSSRSTTLEQVSFRGSSLRNADFLNCELRGVDFTYCDLTGARFTGCTVLGRLYLTYSNVTAEQVADLMDATHPEDRRYIEYPRLSPEEVKQVTGWDDDEFFARVWAGDVEVRDNKTREVVTDGSFNADRHHIPRWGVPHAT